MIQELLVYRKTAVEALQHLDEFTQKMDSFIEEHPTYTVETSLKKRTKDWEIKVIIDNNEK